MRRMVLAAVAALCLVSAHTNSVDAGKWWKRGCSGCAAPVMGCAAPYGCTAPGCYAPSYGCTGPMYAPSCYSSGCGAPNYAPYIYYPSVMPGCAMPQGCGTPGCNTPMWGGYPAGASYHPAATWEDGLASSVYPARFTPGHVAVMPMQAAIPPMPPAEDVVW